MNGIALSELRKTYLKWRTYIGFIAIGIVVPLVMVGLSLDGGGIVRSMTRGLSQDFFIGGNLFNGYFVTNLIMNSLWVHIPFLIALVAGDQLAGEATAGTVRLMLTRPKSRSAILGVKYLTTLVYTASLVVFLATLSVGTGIVLFGTGDLLIPGRDLTIIPLEEVPWRFALAFALAVVSMWCVASLAFLLSAFVENAIGPIIGTMAIIIVFYVISNLPVDFFRSVKPYLFTTYLNVWQEAVREPMNYDSILSSVLRLLAFTVSFYGITWIWYVRKDVLS